MDRPSKLRKLDRFRRSLPHVTAAALAAILLAVQQTGLPELGADRNNYREARNQQALNADTPYGPIMQHAEMLMKGDVPKMIPVAHPMAMLYASVEGCTPFAAYLLDKIRQKPCSQEAPWNLIIYSDEVTPGNPLATLNTTNFQAVYWSFL